MVRKPTFDVTVSVCALKSFLFSGMVFPKKFVFNIEQLLLHFNIFFLFKAFNLTDRFQTIVETMSQKTSDSVSFFRSLYNGI